MPLQSTILGLDEAENKHTQTTPTYKTPTSFFDAPHVF